MIAGGFCHILMVWEGKCLICCIVCFFSAKLALIQNIVSRLSIK